MNATLHGRDGCGGKWIRRILRLGKRETGKLAVDRMSKHSSSRVDGSMEDGLVPASIRVVSRVRAFVRAPLIAITDPIMKQYTLAHRKDFSGITLNANAPKPAIQSPTEVIVKIKALSLNARDLQVANGTYPAPHDIPENVVPVSDASGEIVECGSDVTLWKTGDKVCSVVFLGHDQVSGAEPTSDTLLIRVVRMRTYSTPA